jgi:predicted phosphodiesterase
MRHDSVTLFGVLFLVCCASSPAPASVLARWVQMAPGGYAEARAVVSGDVCPSVDVDATSRAMRVRAQPNRDFPVLLCAMTLPHGAVHASLAGEALPLPKAAPTRLVVLGDTGCRIKGLAVQNCKDPVGWPFPGIARHAAERKPDLVIHVGDYLYREAPCPLARADACGGTPWGDNWATWNADFFVPAAPLLAAAPFVFVRGNHEECDRAGNGWLRLLGPLPVDASQACTNHVAPYAVTIGGATLAVMDDAHASDTEAPKDLVTLYHADLEAVAMLAPAPVFLVLHRPIWGVVRFPFGMVLGGNRTLMAAQKEGGIPANVTLMISGHIHTFEAMNYEKGAPPQILAGEGGDLLDEAPRDLSGQSVGNVKISSGLSLPGYGFLDFAHGPGTSWVIDVLSASGAMERSCTYDARHIDCGTAAKP